jgi:hypothetical protein
MVSDQRVHHRGGFGVDVRVGIIAENRLLRPQHGRLQQPEIG